MVCVDIIAVATSEEVNLVEEDASEERLNSSTSVDGSDFEQKDKADVEGTENEAEDVATSLSKETRGNLCLKAEPAQSTDITMHPVLVAEWGKWMCKDLYEGDKEEDKKCEEEESKLREEIMKKFPRKRILHVESLKLNPEILAYMSGTAKSRDKHFVSSQNVLGSVIVGQGYLPISGTRGK